MLFAETPVNINLPPPGPERVAALAAAGAAAEAVAAAAAGAAAEVAAAASAGAAAEVVMAAAGAAVEVGADAVTEEHSEAESSRPKKRGKRKKSMVDQRDIDTKYRAPAGYRFIIVSNIAYNYAIVTSVMLDVQQREHWAEDLAVQGLTFSAGYIKAFLKRQHFSRRKITTSQKVIPPLTERRRTMKIGQDLILGIARRIHADLARQFPGEDVGLRCYEELKHRVGNYDETPLTYGIGPGHIFGPVDMTRGKHKAGAVDDKVRITLTPLGHANGDISRLFFCIKGGKKCEEQPDARRVRVISSLHGETGFRDEDGWRSCLWTRTMTTMNSRTQQPVTKTYIRPFLRHVTLGHVIVCQVKAWVCQVVFAMFVDLVLHPSQVQRGETFNWKDSCATHLTPAIQAVFEEHKLAEAPLVVNTTNKSQVSMARPPLIATAACPLAAACCC